MTIFKEGDLVEHAFHEDRILGLVVKNNGETELLVERRDGKSSYWNKDQCTVVAREGQWVTTIEIKESANFIDNFHSVVVQLQNAGIAAEKIADLSFDFGKAYDKADKNGTLRQLLEDAGHSVRWL